MTLLGLKKTPLTWEAVAKDIAVSPSAAIYRPMQIGQ